MPRIRERTADEVDPVSTSLDKREPKDVLAKRGIKSFYHVLPAADLPDVLATGALLSAQARGVSSERWGRSRELCADSVCLSFWPSWGMINHQLWDNEPVFITFGPEVLEASGLARFCPHNSGSEVGAEYLRSPASSSATAALECVEQRKDAEVIIPREVPINCAWYLTFYDQQSLESWWPICDATRQLHGFGIDLRPEVTKPDSRSPQFPPQYKLSDASRGHPQRIGEDQRVKRTEPTAAEFASALARVAWKA